MSSRSNRVRQEGASSTSQTIFQEIRAGARLFGGLAEAPAPFDPIARTEMRVLGDRLEQMASLGGDRDRGGAGEGGANKCGRTGDGGPARAASERRAGPQFSHPGFQRGEKRA